MIYLDNAATTLEKPPCVSKAVVNAMTCCASPGRGGHQAAINAADILFRCREKAAELFGVPQADDIVLTHNATHGLNIAIFTLVKPGGKVVISGYEHNAVTRTLHSIPDIEVKVVNSPLFDAGAAIAGFESAITTEIDAVICNHVSNVFGYVQPIEQIAAICRARNVPLIVDASQSAGIFPVSMSNLGAAFVAMPGHKGLYGPQGTGLLLCGRKPEPLLHGGTGSDSHLQNMPEYLPDRLEAGTQNVCGAAGLLAGMNFISRYGLDRIEQHEKKLCHYLADQLKQIPGMRVFKGHDQGGVLSFFVEGKDCEIIGELLASEGIAVRSGFHCAPLAHRTAGTHNSGTIRVSFSVFNTIGQLEYAVRVIKKAIK